MTDLVPPDEIEDIFGVPRQDVDHLGLWRDGMIYIMHSWKCLGANPDLRDCQFSESLDIGVGGNWSAGTIYRLFIRADDRLGNEMWE